MVYSKIEVKVDHLSHQQKHPTTHWAFGNIKQKTRSWSTNAADKKVHLTAPKPVFLVSHRQPAYLIYKRGFRFRDIGDSLQRDQHPPAIIIRAPSSNAAITLFWIRLGADRTPCPTAEPFHPLGTEYTPTRGGARSTSTSSPPGKHDAAAPASRGKRMRQQQQQLFRGSMVNENERPV